VDIESGREIDAVDGVGIRERHVVLEMLLHEVINVGVEAQVLIDLLVEAEVADVVVERVCRVIEEVERTEAPATEEREPAVDRNVDVRAIIDTKLRSSVFV
jgi:hypothetical protein